MAPTSLSTLRGLAPRRLLEDDRGGVEVAGLGAEAAAAQQGDHVLPLALPMAGLCHAPDNLAHSMLDNMPEWPAFLGSLKASINLLTSA